MILGGTQMRKVVRLTLLITTILLINSRGIICSATNDDSDKNNVGTELIQIQSNNHEVKKIQNEIKELIPDEVDELIPDFNPEDIFMDATTGKFDWNIGSILSRICNYFTKEVKKNISILIKLVIVAVFCALLKNIKASFMSEEVNNIAFFACYAAMISIITVSFASVMNLCIDTITEASEFVKIIIPSMYVLLISSGNIVSGGIMQPILIVVVQIIISLLSNVLLPIVFISGILTIVDGLSDEINISKLAKLLRQASKWVLGAVLTVFLSVVTIQGVTGGIMDGVAAKTTKFALGAFIPVAGKYLADAADTVIGCALVVKNAAGILILMGVILICIIPLIKILSIMALYKVAGVVIEPIGEEKFSDCLTDISECITVMIGIVATALFMFVLSITVLLGSGSISTMIQ